MILACEEVCFLLSLKNSFGSRAWLFDLLVNFLMKTMDENNIPATEPETTGETPVEETPETGSPVEGETPAEGTSPENQTV